MTNACIRIYIYNCSNNSSTTLHFSYWKLFHNLSEMNDMSFLFTFEFAMLCNKHAFRLSILSQQSKIFKCWSLMGNHSRSLVDGIHMHIFERNMYYWNLFEISLWINYIKIKWRMFENMYKLWDMEFSFSFIFFLFRKYMYRCNFYFTST